MERGLIDAFEIKFKFALRNLKSAILLGAMLFALALSAEAQQPQKVPRIGYLAVASLSSSTDRIEPFRQGLRELGYVEGKNLIDKILKGTKPADLPVEAPMKYLFAINLKTAKQIGVTFPPLVLSRAEKVIR